MPKSIISISLDTQLVSELQRLSEEQRIAVSHIVDSAVKTYLKRLQKTGRVVTVRGKDQRSEVKL